MSKRLIPLAGFDAYGKHKTAEVRDVRRTRGGGGFRQGQEKVWMRCLLKDLRAFGTKTEQWMLTAQDDYE